MKSNRSTFPTALNMILLVVALVLLILFLPNVGKWFSPSPTNTPTNTLTPSTPTDTATLTPTFTLTITPTDTATPTPTSVLANEPTPSSGYVIYDNFDKDEGKWEYKDNWVDCHRELLKEFEHGIIKLECFGNKSEVVKFTMIPPSASGVRQTQGVEIAFYTLPVQNGKKESGKYELLLRYGPECDPYQRGYVLLIKPNELTFIERGSDHNSIVTPNLSSQKEIIGTKEPHVVKIEWDNGKIKYYLDGKFIRDAIPLENTMPSCWMVQSQDTASSDENGYRGLVLQWIAIKP